MNTKYQPIRVVYLISVLMALGVAGFATSADAADGTR